MTEHLDPKGHPFLDRKESLESLQHRFNQVPRYEMITDKEGRSYRLTTKVAIMGQMKVLGELQGAWLVLPNEKLAYMLTFKSVTKLIRELQELQLIMAKGKRLISLPGK